MARPMSPTTVTALIAAVFMASLVGYQGYLFFFATQSEAVTPETHSYDTSVIATELNPTNAKSVFTTTVTLVAPGGVTSGGVVYDPRELGKSDITQYGQ